MTTPSPMRFPLPDSHNQAHLLGSPLRPDGLTDEQWETLRATTARRDRALFATILLTAVKSFSYALRRPTAPKGWEEDFRAARTYDQAFSAIEGVAPSERPGIKQMLGLVACLDPDLLVDAITDPSGHQDEWARASLNLDRLQSNVDSALSLTAHFDEIPDHVPTEWSNP